MQARCWGRELGMGTGVVFVASGEHEMGTEWGGRVVKVGGAGSIVIMGQL